MGVARQAMCLGVARGATCLTKLTFKVVKKNSPGESCRNRTPASATGA